MKSFLEMWKILEAQELGTNTPLPLSKITPELAKTAVVSGNKDNNPKDDKAPEANPEDTVAVGSLLPMQKEVIPGKALGMAIGFLLNGKPDLNDMEAIVSNDSYIMDGHHRWAAATLINPNRMVKVARVGLPANQLVTALNLWTKAKGRAGNPGKGDVTQFAATIPSLIDEAMNKGIPGEFPISPDQVKQALAKIEGSNGDPNVGAQIMKQNATKLPTQKHPEAPERVDMPVVKNKEEINDVIKKLINGDIDWNAPLSKDTEVAKSTTNMSVGANVSTNALGQTVATPNASQQNVNGGVKTGFQIDVGANTPGAPVQKFPQQGSQPRQVASTSHEGPNLNEWLILSGLKK